MILAVVGILTLSCLPLSVLGTSKDLLFRVDVTIPQEKGRNETDDITFMKSALSGLTGITVHVAMKAVDNQHMILVLGMEGLCSWRSLRSALTRKGYSLSVTALEDCSDYAKLLGTSVTYTPMSHFENLPYFEVAELVFYDEGTTGADYLDHIKRQFEMDAKILALGTKGHCFKAAAELPIRLMYFSPNSIEEVENIVDKVTHEGKARIQFQLLESISLPDQTCT